MIKNIKQILASKRKVKAITGIDFFGRLARALPKEFHEVLDGDFTFGKPYGYYKDKFELDCYKLPQADGHNENYVFKLLTQPDHTTPAALSDFFNDIRHVADKAGYEEVGDRSHMFPDSYCLIKEQPNQFRVLVKH